MHDVRVTHTRNACFAALVLLTNLFPVICVKVETCMLTECPAGSCTGLPGINPPVQRVVLVSRKRCTLSLKRNKTYSVIVQVQGMPSQGRKPRHQRRHRQRAKQKQLQRCPALRLGRACGSVSHPAGPAQGPQLPLCRLRGFAGYNIFFCRHLVVPCTCRQAFRTDRMRLGVEVLHLAFALWHEHAISKSVLSAQDSAPFLHISTRQREPGS